MGFWAEATGSASIRHICCFSSLRPRCDFGQRQLDRPPSGISAAFDTFEQDWVFSRGNQMGLRPAYLLPLTHSGKFGFSAKATRWASNRHICCLWHIRARLGLQQRQPDGPPIGISAAFGTFEQVWGFSKGNQKGLQPAYLLPLVILSKFGLSSEATKSASDRQNCCL